MLAHQAALYIQVSTSTEVINNNQKPYWLNESKTSVKCLDVSLCLHTVNSIVVMSKPEFSRENSKPFQPFNSAFSALYNALQWRSERTEQKRD
jgi:hypothetical protein